MESLAFLKLSPAASFCGSGRFETAAMPPEQTPAFYINDFALSDPRPWKIPELFLAGDEADAFLAAAGESFATPEITWREPDPAQLLEVYADIQKDIADGGIKKSVPVVTEEGVVRKGDPRNLAARLGESGEEQNFYGFYDAEEGFIGVTPELLFTIREDVFRTMALAGTAPAGDKDSFLSDPKQIHEHELVAQYLIQHLADLGVVTRGERECLDLGSIVHFLTHIEVLLDRPRTMEGLVQRLHPTPALGCFPRTMESLRKLHHYRHQLNAPARFGAPFGVLSADGEFNSVVAIRNISWQGDRVFLPAGCGIIEESTFESEWKELELKRRSVKEIFSL